MWAKQNVDLLFCYIPRSTTIIFLIDCAASTSLHWLQNWLLNPGLMFSCRETPPIVSWTDTRGTAETCSSPQSPGSCGPLWLSPTVDWRSVALLVNARNGTYSRVRCTVTVHVSGGSTQPRLRVAALQLRGSQRHRSDYSLIPLMDLWTKNRGRASARLRTSSPCSQRGLSLSLWLRRCSLMWVKHTHTKRTLTETALHSTVYHQISVTAIYDGF